MPLTTNRATILEEAFNMEIPIQLPHIPPLFGPSFYQHLGSCNGRPSAPRPYFLFGCHQAFLRIGIGVWPV